MNDQEYRKTILRIVPTDSIDDQTKESEKRIENMFNTTKNRNAGLAGAGCLLSLGYVAAVLIICALVYYVGALITCGIWNHMVVPAFGLHYTITLFQGFVAWFVLTFVGGFFSVRGGKSSAE